MGNVFIHDIRMCCELIVHFAFDLAALVFLLLVNFWLIRSIGNRVFRSFLNVFAKDSSEILPNKPC